MKVRRDSNTGGQSNSWIHFSYTVELARALANTKGDHRVDLVTRQIASPLRRCLALLTIVAVEPISSTSPVVLAITKGSLWQHIPEFVDGAINHIVNMARALGHSLGQNKFEQLLERGRRPEDINATHKIMKRIEDEEMGLDATEMVVIPLGMDFSYVRTQDLLEGDTNLKSLLTSDRNNRRHLPPIWSKIMRFFTNPHKPTILALSRPDPKTNVTTLLKASGECQPLQDPANMGDFINPALVEPFNLTLIEATAYGFPIVATENGGPVDIVKVLNSGLLIDPQDQKAIADVLLKLVLTKTCEQCRNRHPTTRLEIMKVPEEPMSDSKGCGRSFFKVLKETSSLMGSLMQQHDRKNSLKPTPRRLP
ncbi:hypothetical protein Pint_30571 [Pistacia integerrima]|uniref:Uncharacterized protein n=1 Tax=Pistacia integerrima TaxID=434235 RepID=A0ACC0X101_9ROSI|nr:hypothetical protein Pint_30571 [Pistacia integerrima]